jgi:crossover junction endodeoxyribonuclease RusA
MLTRDRLDPTRQEHEMAENKINTEWTKPARIYPDAVALTVPPGCQPAGPGALSVWVAGRPAPQGSKRHVGRGVMIESSRAVKPWREDIRQAMLRTVIGLAGDPISRKLITDPTSAVVVKLVFVMPRPTATPKRRTPAAVKRPDLDKLVRAVFDAIGSAGVWADDSQVVTVHAHKRLAELGETTGVMIHIEPVTVPLCGHPAHTSGCTLDGGLVVNGASLPSVPVSHVE